MYFYTQENDYKTPQTRTYYFWRAVTLWSLWPVSSYSGSTLPDRTFQSSLRLPTPLFTHFHLDIWHKLAVSISQWLPLSIVLWMYASFFFWLVENLKSLKFQVCWAKQAKHYCTVRRAKQICISIVVVSIMYNSLRFPQFNLRKCFNDITKEQVIEICPTSLFVTINSVYNM